MGSLIEETKQELTDLSDERSWAHTLRKRYRTIMKQKPEYADEYDVADAQEILAEYLFPIQPSMHVNWPVKVLSAIILILIELVTSFFAASFIIYVLLPNAANHIQKLVAAATFLIVIFSVTTAYVGQRSSAHKTIVARRAKKLRKWLSKTRV